MKSLPRPGYFWWFAPGLSVLGLAFAAHAQDQKSGDWPAYGNDPGGMRYSVLAQIDRANVSQLKVAWTFHTGDISDGSSHRRRSGFETTPILVDGTLYLTTPFNRVIALDPASGKQRWAYDTEIDQALDYGDGLINRGVAAWLDSSRSAEQACRRRIFEATLDARLIALDAASGNATPMTYQIRERQYLVIAAGGHQRIPEEPLGDALVAFALP